METRLETSSTTAASKAAKIIGWILSILAMGLMLLSAYFKLSRSPIAVKGFADAGYSDAALFYIGIVEVACAILYLIPQTAVLGAILVAAYLGGATNHHVRLNESYIGPVLIGVVAWLGLYLRDRRLRQLVPIRR